MRRGATSKRLPQTIEREEYDRLIAQPSSRAPTGIRNVAMIATMYDCGLRVSEVCNLAPRDLLRSGPSAPSLRVRRGKGGRDRENLGVPSATWALLERWAAVRPSSRWFFSTLDGEPVKPRYVHQMVTRYATKASVFKITDTNEPVPINPHVLRHSYATRLIEAGVPVHEVQAALGHASLQTTAVYLHVRSGKLAANLRAALDVENGDTATSAMRALIREELEAIISGRQRQRR